MLVILSSVAHRAVQGENCMSSSRHLTSTTLAFVGTAASAVEPPLIFVPTVSWNVFSSVAGTGESAGAASKERCPLGFGGFVS